MGEADYRFKVVVIGAAGTGKTALVDRLITGHFSSHSRSTIGVAYHPYRAQISDATVQLDLWDTAGQETYKSVARSYFRGSVGAILVFDITSDASFDELQFWLAQFRHLADPNALVLLVGNKADRADQRCIDPEAAEQFARDHVVSYIETSALTAKNVSEAFEKMARGILELVVMERLQAGRQPAKAQREFVSKWPSVWDPAQETERCC
jgi:Ras-related protein Rab-11A